MVAKGKHSAFSTQHSALSIQPARQHLTLSISGPLLVPCPGMLQYRSGLNAECCAVKLHLAVIAGI
jgi:hypothetical protein